MMLGLVLLSVGLLSGIARMLLFSAIKNKYPKQYAKIGSPAVFFQNLELWIPLGRIKGEVEEADFRRFSRLNRLIQVGEGVLVAAIVYFPLRALIQDGVL